VLHKYVYYAALPAPISHEAGVLQCVAVHCSVLYRYASMLLCEVPLLVGQVCCRVLQSVAECCSALQYIAVCCTGMRLCCSVSFYYSWFICVAVHCSVLQCIAVCCSVLYCVAVCCTGMRTMLLCELPLVMCQVCYSVLKCVAVCCSVLQCVAVVCCSVLQCVVVYCCVLQGVAVCRVLRCAASSICLWVREFCCQSCRTYGCVMSHIIGTRKQFTCTT